MAERTAAEGTRTDRELMHAAALGDPDALDAFKERYGDYVRRLLSVSGVRKDRRGALTDSVLLAAATRQLDLGAEDATSLLRRLVRQAALGAQREARRAARTERNAQLAASAARDRQQSHPRGEAHSTDAALLRALIRHERATRRAIEGTDDDPLVRARRARERLAAIDV